MKKAILLLTILTFTAMASTFAQDSAASTGTNEKRMRTGEKGGGRMAMLDSLNLSADQKQQVQSEFAEMKQKRADIKNDNSLSEQDKSEKMKTLRDEEKKKMQTILTPEQRKKYEEMMKGHKAQGADQ